jgi:glycosyltransferase involved in cell wall biosynthesis
LTTELGLDGQVTFHGRMGIAQALPLGKVFILPSRLESFPYVVLEVIAAGRAIVSTKVGGLGEVLPEAVLCEKENVRALSAKLTDVFDNLPMFQKVADQVCKDAPQNFSAETMVKKITDFYSRLK